MEALIVGYDSYVHCYIRGHLSKECGAIIFVRLPLEVVYARSQRSDGLETHIKKLARADNERA